MRRAGDVGWTPAGVFAPRAGRGTDRVRRGARDFVPSDLPPNVTAVGSVAGDVAPAAVPAASFGGAVGEARCFVCICEDVTEKDVKRSIAEGFDSIELASATRR